MGFDGRTPIGKAIGNIICRTEIVFGKEGIESFGTKEASGEDAGTASEV